MKSPYASGLVPDEVITAQFIVTSKEIRQKKSGEPYLSLQLADRTGELDAKMWDNVAEVMHAFERDDFVKVKGLVQIYQKRSQFTIHRLRRMEDHEVDFADYFPCSERDTAEMMVELESIIAGLKNTHLRSLLQAVFRDPEISVKYRTAPAAKSIHHACRGGLLEHVLSLCVLSKLTAEHYKTIDLDLVLAGAIMHDIGKIEELSYNRSFGYSAEGQLLGHIVIGLRILSDKIREVPDFPHPLRTLLEHMIISHHGELAFGSPKVPIFPEAMLLHHLDNLDSKMEAVRASLERDSTVEGDFTGWIPSLERVLLRKDRYLQRTSSPASNAPIQPVGDSDAGTPIDVLSPSNAPTETPSPAKPATPPAPSKIVSPTTNAPQSKPSRPTLFGEKLQAVLGTDK
jgi:3'-5' exoribonuclease